MAAVMLQEHLVMCSLVSGETQQQEALPNALAKMGKRVQCRLAIYSVVDVADTETGRH